MRRAFVVFSFFLGACGGPADFGTSDSGPDAQVGDDAATIADAATEADAATNGNGIPAATAPCLWRHGIHSAASTWNYRWLSPVRIGARQMTVFEHDGAQHSATLKTTESWTQTTGGVSFTGTTYEYVVCNDDGLYITRRKVQSTFTTTVGSTQTTVTNTDSVYSAPALVRPNTLALNDTWTTHRVGTTTSPGTPDQSFDNTSTTSVVDVDVLIVGTNNYNTVKTDNGIYWQLGFGVVRDTTIYTLESFVPGTPQP